MWNTSTSRYLLHGICHSHCHTSPWKEPPAVARLGGYLSSLLSLQTTDHFLMAMPAISTWDSPHWSCEHPGGSLRHCGSFRCGPMPSPKSPHLCAVRAWNPCVDVVEVSPLIPSWLVGFYSSLPMTWSRGKGKRSLLFRHGSPTPFFFPIMFVSTVGPLVDHSLR